MSFARGKAVGNWERRSTPIFFPTSSHPWWIGTKYLPNHFMRELNTISYCLNSLAIIPKSSATVMIVNSFLRICRYFSSHVRCWTFNQTSTSIEQFDFRISTNRRTIHIFLDISLEITRSFPGRPKLPAACDSPVDLFLPSHGGCGWLRQILGPRFVIHVWRARCRW